MFVNTTYSKATKLVVVDIYVGYSQIGDGEKELQSTLGIGEESNGDEQAIRRRHEEQPEFAESA